MTNIFWIQVYDSVLCRSFCIGFTDFIPKGKSLTHFTNIFSPNNFEKTILKMVECNSIRAHNIYSNLYDQH